MALTNIPTLVLVTMLCVPATAVWLRLSNHPRNATIPPASERVRPQSRRGK